MVCAIQSPKEMAKQKVVCKLMLMGHHFSAQSTIISKKSGQSHGSHIVVLFSILLRSPHEYSVFR